MAVTLRTYLNNKLKEKGITAAQAKKNAGKYKSIAAAKKAGSLYYTNKDGKVMAAVYAEDLKKATVRPKKKPGAPTLRERNPVETDYLLPGTGKTLDEVFTKAEINAASKRAREQLGTDAKPYTKSVPGKAIYEAIKENTSVSEIKARAKKESEKRSRYKRGASAG